mgnify:CR=1 FL=1
MIKLIKPSHLSQKVRVINKLTKEYGFYIYLVIDDNYIMIFNNQETDNLMCKKFCKTDDDIRFIFYQLQKIEQMVHKVLTNSIHDIISKKYIKYSYYFKI